MPRLWAIRMAKAVAVLLATAIVLALVVHAPPVRRAALDRVIAFVAERFDIALRADALDYNLATLRASLANVQVAARRSPQAPLLTAGSVEITVPLSVLFGRTAIDRLTIQNARLRIVRQADGTTNLPQPETTSASRRPAPLPIGRLRIPRLAVSVVDEVNALSLELPAVAVDVGAADGSVRTNEPGRIQREGTGTTLTVDAGVAFDGRALRLSNGAVAAPEGTIDVDGTLGLLVAEPRLDLGLALRANLSALRRLVPALPGIDGPIAIDGTLEGPLAQPTAALRVRSDGLTWDTVALSPVDAALAIDTASVRIASFDAGMAGGRLGGNGAMDFGSRQVDLQVSWSALDLEALSRTLVSAGPRPSGRAAGAATIRGAGTDIGGWTIEARTRIAPGTGGRGRVVVGGDTGLRVVDGRWSIDASGTAGAAPIRARVGGRIDPTSLTASTLGGTVDVSDAALPALVDAWSDAALIDIDREAVDAGRLNAHLVLGGTLARPRLELTAAADEVAAGGVAGLAATAAARGTLRQLDVEARVSHGVNELNAVGTVSPDAGRLDLRVRGTVRDLQRLQPNIPAAGVATVDLRVQGPFSGVGAAGDVTIADATYSGVSLGRLQATVRADARTARVDVESPELRARAQVEIALVGARAATISAVVDAAQLERVLRQIELPAPVSGTISLEARGTVPLDDWRRGTAVIDLTEVAARIGDLPLRLTAPTQVSYERDTLSLKGLEADLGRTRLSASGRLPLVGGTADDGVRLQLAGDVGDAIDAARSAGLIEQPAVAARGRLSLTGRIAGSIDRPAIDADLDVTAAELGVQDLPPVRIPELRAAIAGGWIDRLTVTGEWQGSRVDAEARAPLRLFGAYLPQRLIAALPASDGPATMNARLSAFTPAVLSPFVDAETLAQLAGAVDASVRLETTSLDVADLRGEARLDRLELELAGLPVTQAEPTRVAFERGLARVAAWRWTGGGATLDVQGEIGLVDQRAALLAAGQLDLRVLGPFVRGAGAALAGTLGTRISVSGSLTDPRIDGEATVAGAELRLREPRIVATGVDAFAVLTPTRVRITDLNGVVNGGTLTGGGEIAYSQDGGATGRLTAVVAGMGLDFPDGLRSEIDADLALSLEPDAGAPAGRVTGTVTVVRGAYREPVTLVGGVLGQLRSARTGAAAAPSDGFASRLALDVRLVTDDDLVVDNNLARLQMGGDLRIIGTAAAPSLAGRAELRPGGQLFLGSNVYTIESGTADFTDPTAIVPDLTVRGTTRAGGHEIEIALNGPPADLEVALQSLTDPELGQADVASLLLTGRVLDDVSGAEGQIVAEQVLGYLSGDLLAIAGRTLGLDTIRLGGPEVSSRRRDPSAIAGEVDPTSRLTFTKVIDDEIELTYSQSLRDGDAQTWIVDYRPITRINLRLVSDDDDLRSYEFRHEVTVGGGRTERQAAARPAAPEPDVAGVAFTGDLVVPEPELREALRLEPGHTFDFAEWQADRERLEALLHRAGRLEARVTAQRADQEGGALLTYQLAAGPPTSLTVTGYPLAAADREQIEAAWSESVFDEFLREDAEAIARAALGRAGYFEPRIDTAVEPGATKHLRIDIEPGARTTARRLLLDPRHDELARVLDEWLAQQDVAAAWTAPERLQRDLLEELRARGYLAAQVSVGEPRAEAGVSVLPVRVDLGVPFTVAAVRFTGAARLDPARLQDAAALAAQDAYRPADVDAARDRIDALYRREGFAAARVTAGTSVDAAARSVSVEFSIVEGRRQVLREVVVRGNRGIDTQVIERELALSVGDPVGGDEWLQARARLFETGLFRRADVVIESSDVPATADERPVRLVATVEEWPALRLRYGLQLSEARPEDSLDGRDVLPGLSADVTRRTLFGRALRLGAALEYRRRERLVRGFLNAPTFFGWPVESLFSVERTYRQFADARFVTNLSGVAWEQRVRRGPVQLSYSYRFERDHTYETGVPDDPFLPPYDVAVSIARLNGSGVFDTRDDPTKTTRGWLLSSSLELSPVSLGSDVAFVRQAAQAYHFRPWRRVVFASAGRFSVISPLAGHALIPSLLFFAGGPRSVRGVGEDSLGPRDVFGEAAGGRVLLVLNQEARFPIYRWVGGVGFLDAGNVFTEPGDVSVGRLVTTFGGGLRIDTPFAMVRIDYGRKWLNASGVRLSEWTFGIGHAF